MNRITLLAACLLVGAAAPAAAQSVGERTGVNSVLGVAPSTQDFVTQAAISDMFEIRSSEAAQSMAQDPKVKELAQHMIEAHTKTSDQLKSAVQEKGIKATIPTDLDASHADMLKELKEEKGADFDEEYVDDQVTAHKNAVSLFERYAEGGEDPTLKEWAGKTLPELKRHLEMAQQLDK